MQSGVGDTIRYAGTLNFALSPYWYISKSQREGIRFKGFVYFFKKFLDAVFVVITKGWPEEKGRPYGRPFENHQFWLLGSATGGLQKAPSKGRVTPRWPKVQRVGAQPFNKRIA